MDDPNLLGQIAGLVSTHPWASLLSAIAGSGIVGSGIFAYLRRIPSSEAEGRRIEGYFQATRLLSPPLERPAYSDRMAYVLAEMSDLAYYEFEGPGGTVLDAVKRFKRLEQDEEGTLERFFEEFSRELMGGRALSTDFLRDLLEAADFDLLRTIDVGETQGFACRRNRPGEPPYVVVAFRGTEKKVSDWLTDARAMPTERGDSKVHTGFLEAFTEVRDNDQKTVEDRVREILNSKDALSESGEPLPVFLTGHSLGGALALIATRQLVPNVNGACYTFGAPRVANYEFFREVKTPVYRVVNSSDIVPRVPPGAINIVLLGAVKGIGWITAALGPISDLIGKLERLLDRLNGYRHFGDQRYLTDVATGRWSDVRLLRNPPAIDRVIWMWKHLAASLFVPLKAHSMSIYRKKLRYIASQRS